MAREIDLSKPLDEETVTYLKATRPMDYVNRMIELAGSADAEPAADPKPDPNGEMKEGDDPSDFNVSSVQAFLLTASEEETARVLEAEKAGKARKNVLEG